MIIKFGIWCSLILGALFSGLIKNSSDNFSTQEDFSKIAPIPEKMWGRELDSTIISTPIHTGDSNVIIKTYLGSIYCLDALTGEENWKINSSSRRAVVMAADFSLGSLILLERDYGSLISVNQKNGEPNWEKRFNYLKTAKFISFMSGNKFLVSGGLDNSIHVFNSISGEYEWSYSADGKIRSTPIYSKNEDFIIFNTRTTICALRKNDGEMVWARTLDCPLSSGISEIHNRSLCFGTEDGFVHSIGARKGLSKWKYRSDGLINSTPLVDHHGNVFIQAKDDQSYLLKGKTGEVLWKQETGLSLGCPIQFDYRGNFLINRNLNEIALLCGQSGDELWDFKLSENSVFYPSTPLLLPDLHGNDMIVSGRGKTVRAFLKN
jgi:outer membrane protein assembly factor BamB